MDHTGERGFIELAIVIVGIGLALIGAFHPSQLFTSETEAAKPTTIPTVLPTATASPAPPEPFRVEQGIGLAISEDLTVEASTSGRVKQVILLGVEPSATRSACLTDADHARLTKIVTGKRVYLVDYEGGIVGQDTILRYVFLDDSTLLNESLIRDGFALARDKQHPYHDEFMKAQEDAQAAKVGFWSDACTARIEKPALFTAIANPEPTATPTDTPTPTQIPTLSFIVSSSPAPHPSATPTATRTPTPTPTVTLERYIPSPQPSPTITQSLNADLILQLVNLHRKQMNLPAYEKDPELCKLADSRAPELNYEIFGGGTVHAGLYSRNIPYWITENMASYPSEDAVVNWWLGSPIHRAAIEGNYKYSCGACSGNSCAQLFTSWVPK